MVPHITVEHDSAGRARSSKLRYLTIQDRVWLFVLYGVSAYTLSGWLANQCVWTFPSTRQNWTLVRRSLRHRPSTNHQMWPTGLPPNTIKKCHVKWT